MWLCTPELGTRFPVVADEMDDTPGPRPESQHGVQVFSLHTLLGNTCKILGDASNRASAKKPEPASFLFSTQSIIDIW
jgi:hypothetical protein